MSIALRGTATSGTTTVTAPTGVANGDILVAIVIAPSGTTITVPSGWTTVRNVTASNTSSIRMVVATFAWTTGAATSWSFTGATFNVCSGYSGCDTTTPLLAENYATGANQSTLATPTVNNTNSGGWRIAGWGAADSVFSSMGAWTTFSPTDTRRAENHNTQYAVALTDSNATVATGNTSITGTTPASNNGLEAEIAWIGILAPPASTPISSSDTASDTESASITNAATDTATSTESTTIVASTPATETSTATDTASVAPTASDTAAGTESAAVAPKVSETATAAEAAQITTTATDTGAASDSAFVSVATPTSDSGSAADSGRVAPNVTDNATATDAASVTATTPATDSATGTETASVAIGKPATDSATATDSAIVLVGIPTTDTAGTLESARLTVHATDTAVARDTATVRHAGQGVPGRLRRITVLPRLPVWTGPGR